MGKPMLAECFDDTSEDTDEELQEVVKATAILPSTREIT
jgi:hypothetical protein